MSYLGIFTKGRIFLLPILIALIAFEMVVGHERLIPTNIAWLTRTGWSDGWGAYLGWETYRYSPWTFPVGSNLPYGMNIGNSIVYTDSIPLLAIPFKLISTLLPVPFQYFGFWLLGCFCLQATFAWRIVSRYTSSKLILTCTTIIFLFSPILLNRLNVHMSQVGHFLFLWALLLILKKDTKNTLNWFFLMSVSALVHPYFLVLNLLLFLANELYLRNIFAYGYLRLLKNSLILLVSILPILWLAGYFISIDGSTNPFYNDLFKMDLVQPLNFTGWSLLLARSFPNQQGNFEGFNYLGPGTLFLALLSLSTMWSIWLIKGRPIKFRKEFFPFILILALLTLYATTYKITFARYELLNLPIPDEIKLLLTSFRASGRFFAPVFYFTTFFVLKIFVGFSKNRLTSSLLIFAALLQVIDTQPGWKPIKSINQPANSLALGNMDLQKWSGILSEKEAIISIPSETPTELCPEWRLVGYLTYTFRLNTNCFYFARSSEQRRLLNRQSSIGMLEQGDPTGKVVIILNSKDFTRYFQPNLSDNWNLYELGGLFVLSSTKP